MEACKWEVDTQMEIVHERPIKRHLIRGCGGLWPVLLKLQDGNLLAVVRSGDGSMGERGMFEVLFSPDGGISWTRPVPIPASGPDNRNPGAGVLSDGTVLVAYAEMDTYVHGWPISERLEERGCTLRTIRSQDGGRTWSPPLALEEGGWPRRSPFGKIVELPDGTILMAVYHFGEGKDSSWVYRSGDGGQTWTDATQIAEGDRDTGFNETALLCLPSGKLIAMMRGTGSRSAKEAKYIDPDTRQRATGRPLWQTNSLDGGYTWDEPRQVTGPEEHPGDLLLLQSAKILLTYGHRVVPHGVRAMLSYDDGETWDAEHKITLAADSADNGCGYPSSVQLDDGTICTAFYVCESLAYGRVRGRLGPSAWVVRYKEEDILPGTQ